MGYDVLQEGVPLAFPAAHSLVCRLHMIESLTPGSQYGTLTVGVRFRPGRAPGFLGVGAAELTDRSATLDELWGWDAIFLAERLAAAPSIEDKEALQALLDSGT